MQNFFSRMFGMIASHRHRNRREAENRHEPRHANRRSLPDPQTVSVITPSFNQGRFISACIASVAAQTYSPIEHLIYDPGSSDDSLSIIRSHADVTLINEPDEGQADAVSKGMSVARGDIIAWLNADDCYSDPDVFQAVMDRFRLPDHPDIVYGRGCYVDEHGKTLRQAYVNRRPHTLPIRLQQELGILQPALFIHRRVIDTIGTLNTDLHYALDYEYWIRAAKCKLVFAFVDRTFAHARYYPDNKTLGRRGDSYREVFRMLHKHWGYVHHAWIRRLAEFEVDQFDGILKSSGNQHVSDPVALERNKRNLHCAWNTDWHTLSVLKQQRNSRPVGTTIEAMRSLDIKLTRHCRPVPENKQSLPGCQCYTVGGERRWAFERKWLESELNRTREAFERFRSEREKDRCIIVGNGPSLNQTNLALLSGRDVFCSNYAFLKPELFRHATYLCIVNHLVAQQAHGEINLLTNVKKLFPYWLSYCLNGDENTFFFRSVGIPHFSTDIHQNVSWRHTVSFFMLQIAYWLGYQTVLLVGFDHSYQQRSGVNEGDVIDQESDDANHFDKSYFKGKRWHAADVDNMEKMYELARAAYESDGRQILNATAGGQLEIFPRVDLASCLSEQMIGNRM